MFRTIIMIAIGGAIGSVFRYLVGVTVSKFFTSTFPISTFVVNIFGCFCIGLSIGFLQKNNLINTDLNRFLVTGVCGGFTTFSAFGQENLQLLEQQHFTISMLYVLLSVILGIVAVGLGHFMTKL